MLVLMGFMGCGKSTVAPLVGARLGWPSVDTDAALEERFGATCAELIEERGWPAFRAAESDVALGLLSGPESLVVAFGGGTITNSAVQESLSRASPDSRPFVVWLRVRWETVLARVGGDNSRPLLRQDRAAELFEDRQQLYRDYAHAVIDVDDLTPDMVADLVVQVWLSCRPQTRRGG